MGFESSVECSKVIGLKGIRLKVFVAAFYPLEQAMEWYFLGASVEVAGEM